MFDKKLITLSIASALLTSSLATANTPDDKDSVFQYGPWGQNYATAAGGEFNTNSLNFSTFSGNDTGRNGANEPGFDSPQSDGACSAGAYCGFAEVAHGYDVDDVGYIQIDVSPSHFSDGGFQGGLTGGFSISGNDDIDVGIDGMEGHHSSDYGSLYTPQSGDDSYLSYWHRPTYSGGYRIAPNGYQNPDSRGTVYGGITTSLDQLNTFVSGLNGVVARYNVEVRNGEFGSFIEIDFGDNSWDASFTGSKESNNGFVVTNGAVSGINFTAGSNQLSADGATVTGLVAGAIFGSNAQEVAGMIDIEKTIIGSEGSPIIRQTLFRTETK